MTQQERVFPVGNGVPREGAQEGHKRNSMNFGAELRALAKTLGAHDAELLGAVADRLETLLDETDQLSMLLNDAGGRLRGVVDSTAACLHLLTIASVTPAAQGERGAV